MPPVNDILTMRRHQVVQLPFIGRALIGIALDILAPVRGVRLVDQYDRRGIMLEEPKTGGGRGIFKDP